MNSLQAEAASFGVWLCNCHLELVRRPVQLLYPLEVHSDCGSFTANNSADGAGEDEIAAD